MDKDKPYIEHPRDVPWLNISGMRNKLIREYFGVDIDVVWKTITEDLPTLKEKLGKK